MRRKDGLIAEHIFNRKRRDDFAETEVWKNEFQRFMDSLMVALISCFQTESDRRRKKEEFVKICILASLM